MIINTNIDAMKTLRSLNNNTRKNDKVMEKLASGMKINRAADDSAGLAISTKMRAQIRGLSQNERNIDDGISMFNTAEGGMEQIENMIHRIRELAVQSANDVNTDADRKLMQKEVEELIKGIDQIANDTEFNTHKVIRAPGAIFIGNNTLTSSLPRLNAIGTNWISNAVLPSNPGTGALDSLSSFALADPANPSQILPGFSSGQYSIDDTIDRTFQTYTNASGVTFTSFGDFLQNIDATDRNDAQCLVDAIAAALNDQLPASYPDIVGLVLDAPNGELNIGFRVGDGKDYLLIFTGCTNALTNSIGHGYLHATFGGKMVVETNKYIIQVGPNTDQNILFDIPSMNSYAVGVPPTVIAQANIALRTSAENTIELCDIALSYVNDGRALMGAHVNRLESAMSNVTTTGENTSAAESRLRDANMSKEVVEQVKESILTQAATTMLAQANQRPEGVLQLLR